MLIETSAAALLGLSIYSWFIEPHRYRIMRHKIQMKGPSIKPLAILQISDLHFYRGQTSLQRFLEELTKWAVDLIFITGDLIDDDSGIDLCLEALRPLRAKYGSYCVFGNHDYDCVDWRHLFHRTGKPLKEMKRRPNDSKRLEAGLYSLGISVLHNQWTRIAVDGGAVAVVGVDDPYSERDDIPATFRGYRKEEPCFVLVHAPDRYRELSEAGADMVFSGHTHGGQIRIPFAGPVITRSKAPKRFASGFARLNGTLYHATRGAGSSRLTRPRFSCPPEVNLFEIEFVQEDKPKNSFAE
ncbi:MAG: metallophosphoesterase [Candidatus Omnitrophota bacterium]